MNPQRTSSEAKIRQLEYEIEELKDRLHQAEKLLDDVYKSKTWRLGQLYGRIFGVESLFRKKVCGLMKKCMPAPQETALCGYVPRHIPATYEQRALLEEYIERSETSTGIFIVVAETGIAERISFRTDQLSHRAIRLAREFDAMGYSVVFVFTESKGQDQDGRMELLSENILQMQLSLFLGLYRSILDNLKCSHKQRTLVIHILHPAIVEILMYANAHGWITVYDCLDNWEEFFKQGWHSWYDRRVEEFVLQNVDHRITVSTFLKEKFRQYEPIHIVHNGYSPDMVSGYARGLKKGQITIGYMGNLQEFRFDWEFLKVVAERKKEWIFYVVGLLPKGITLSGNIIHLPPVKPKFLSAYAANWDVAMIPFKINPLTLSCDNLKIYEYLLFRLPVVARGVGEHARRYPYVSIAETEEEFIHNIEVAASTKIEEEKLSPFLQQSDWTSRARQFLKVLQSGHQHYKTVFYESPRYP